MATDVWAKLAACEVADAETTADNRLAKRWRDAGHVGIRPVVMLTSEDDIAPGTGAAKGVADLVRTRAWPAQRQRGQPETTCFGWRVAVELANAQNALEAAR